MHKTDVNTEFFNKQANGVVNTTIPTDVRQLSFDIESSATDGIILVDALFSAIDGMTEVPAHLQRSVSAINCFATCTKRHLALIVEATGKVQSSTLAGVAQ